MAGKTLKLAALAGLAKQARDYARKNPDTVSSSIGKVESVVSRRVGPKYAGHVSKGGNALRAGLGIPQNRAVTPAPAPGPGETTTPPSA